MVFSIPNFTTVGDDYDKKRVVDERSKGKSFVSNSGATGKNPDALFTKVFQSIHEGDKFIDPGTQDRRDKIEKKKKNLCPQGFKMASFPQKPAGSGSYYGTLDGKAIPHETDFNVVRKGDEVPKRQPAPRPILTNPSKKGHYGTPGLTLSDVGQEYIADFYDARRAADKKANEESKKKFKGDGKPFTISGRNAGTFDTTPNAGVSSCYTLTQPLPPRRVPQLNKYSIVHKKLDHAWKPAGKAPCNAIVEYREDPYDHSDPRDPPRKKREEAAKANVGGQPKPAWKPNPTTNDFWYTSTIAFKKL